MPRPANFIIVPSERRKRKKEVSEAAFFMEVEAEAVNTKSMVAEAVKRKSLEFEALSLFLNFYLFH